MEQNRKLIYQRIPTISMDEVVIIEMHSKDFDKEKMTDFINVYAGKRIDSNTILMTTLIAFVGVAGINRFYIGQIGMGLLYFFTWGLCGIGLIMDLINYKKLATEKNREIALESSALF